MEYRKGVFIVVYRKEKDKIFYLLLKRHLHWKGWEFPKGGLEKNESILDSLNREVKEETGQLPNNILNHRITGKYKYSKEIQERSEIGQTFTLYSANINKKEIKIDSREHSGFKWVDYNTALKELKWPNQRKCLRIVNAYLNKTQTKMFIPTS